MNAELREKLISDSDKCENILRQFPNNVGGGNSIMGTATDLRGIYKSLMDFIDEKRNEAAARVHDIVTQWVEENDASLLTLSRFLKVDSTIIRRAGYTPARTWKTRQADNNSIGNGLNWWPCNCAEKFCYYIAKTSCHELYLGFEGMTLLPHRFSALVELIKKSDCPDEVRAKLNTIAKSTYDVNSENYYNIEDDDNFGNMSIQLCKERLDEICEDRYVPSISVTKNMPSFVKPRLNGLFTDVKSKPKAVTVLSIALMIGTTVDYFSAIDYLQRTRAYYYTPDGEKYTVCMKDHGWLRTVVALPREIQNRVLKEMYAVVLPTIHTENLFDTVSEQGKS